MNQERRSCWRCGRWAFCFIEICRRCAMPVVCACELCVNQTAGAVVEHQDADHDKRCASMPVGPVRHPARAAS